MNASSEGAADEDPEGSREIAELSGQYRAYQGARAGNGCEVMPEHDPSVGGDEILAVLLCIGRGGALIIKR